MNVQGIDVSNHQHPVGRPDPDWSAVAASGIRFAWVLATDGSTFANRFRDFDLTHARQNGIKVGG